MIIIHNQVIDKTICDQALQQMEICKLTVGFHHGLLNHLPLMWKYPHMNMIKMITMYLMALKVEGVTALRLLYSAQVNHSAKEGSNQSRMQWLMKHVKHYAEQRGVWKPNNASNYWNGNTVTIVWDGIWKDLRRHLLTVTEHDNKPPSFHKASVPLCC